MSNKSGKKRKRVSRMPPNPKKKMKAGEVSASIDELVKRFNFIWQDYTILKINFEALLWLQHRAWWFRWIPVLNALIDIWWMSDSMIRWAGAQIMKKQMKQRDKEEAEQRAKIVTQLEESLKTEKKETEQNKTKGVDNVAPEGTKVEVSENENKKYPDELLKIGSPQEKGEYEKSVSVEDESTVLEEAEEVASV